MLWFYVNNHFWTFNGSNWVYSPSWDRFSWKIVNLSNFSKNSNFMSQFVSKYGIVPFECLFEWSGGLRMVENGRLTPLNPSTNWAEIDENAISSIRIHFVELAVQEGSKIGSFGSSGAKSRVFASNIHPQLTEDGLKWKFNPWKCHHSSRRDWFSCIHINLRTFSEKNFKIFS